MLAFLFNKRFVHASATTADFVNWIIVLLPPDAPQSAKNDQSHRFLRLEKAMCFCACQLISCQHWLNTVAIVFTACLSKRGFVLLLPLPPFHQHRQQQQLLFV